MEEVVFGFTVILGSPDSVELQRPLHERLNRLQHLLWKQPADLVFHSALEHEEFAVRHAWVVVVIATPQFCRSRRGKCLMNIADGERRRVITISERRPRPGEGCPWSSNVHLYISDYSGIDALTMAVSGKIKWIEETLGTNRPRGPVGRPGLFFFLSYRRDEADLARPVREHLRREAITTWDYGDSPRSEMKYRDEIANKTRRARSVIFLLSRGWLASPECQHEASLATEAHKRCVWLLCDDSQPPGNVNATECVDFRLNQQEALERLSRLLFPSRRTRRAQMEQAPGRQ